MLHVAPSAFEVIQLRGEREGPAYAALRAALPRLDPLVEELEQRRSDPSAVYVQRYAREIIEDGTFGLPSLSSDGAVHAVASYLLNDKSVFYAFDNDPDLLVGASFLADGFALAAIVIPSRKVMINLGDPVWGMGHGHLRALHDVSSRHEVDSMPDADPAHVTVITGDPNFAHHVWNQLAAFDAIAPHVDALDIIATHQPLGPITQLFPETSRWSVEYFPDSYLEKRNRTGRMFVSLGSVRISRDVQERVQRYARSRLSERAGAIVERIAATRRPMFWLSIRTRNRTADNQTDALVAISRELMLAYPTACVVLDGHSVAADFETNPSYDRPGTLAIIAADQAVADEVIGRLRADGAVGEANDVVSLVGCDILDSIGVASLADMYFCHHGTVQHKIGWLTDVPGIVHCNRRTLALQPARWVAAQVEDGVEPTYVDASLIEDEAPPAGLTEVDDSLRLECYRFVDIGRLAQMVVAAARAVVADGPEPPRAAGSVPSVADEVHVVPVPRVAHVNGERNAMRADTSDSAADDFEHIDRLELQRELLRVRNEWVQARKAKELVTGELVELAGRLQVAQEAADRSAAETATLRDELARRDAERDAVRRERGAHETQLADLQAELGRRDLVAGRLNDELVRRDVELLDLRAELAASQRRTAELDAELACRSFSAETLLAIINVQRATAHTRPQRPRVSLLRRVARRARRFVREFAAALARRRSAH